MPLESLKVDMEHAPHPQDGTHGVVTLHFYITNESGEEEEITIPLLNENNALTVADVLVSFCARRMQIEGKIQSTLYFLKKILLIWNISFWKSRSSAGKIAKE